MSNTLIDMVGLKFGRLTVTELDNNTRGNGAYWICQCDCGNTISVRGHELRSGHTKSCGCLRYKTGHFPKKLYASWVSMKARCNQKSASNWHLYGGRGIKVCDEWNDYIPFRDWALRNGWRDGLTIDRIDIDGNYEPSNCRWVDVITQNRNKRDNHLVSVYGKKMCLKEAAEYLGVSRGKLGYRLKTGKAPEGVIDCGFERLPDRIYPRNRKRMA